jgi:diacylglycerol kinase family enzyme
MHIFIVNPAAPRCPKDIERRIRARFPEAEIRFTAGAGETGALSRQVLAERSERHATVVACGGDGTFREVAEEVGGRVHLGILPLGTINLVSRQLEVPRQLDDALDCLAQAETAHIYPGRCRLDGNRRSVMFFIGVSAGLDADAVHAMRPVWKRRVGRFAYLASFLGCVGRTREPVRVACGGETWTAAQVVALKMPTYAGSYRLGRRATLASPGIEVVSVEGGRLPVLRLFWNAFRGCSADGPGTRRGVVTALRLRLPAPGRVQIDGDPFFALEAEIYPHPAPLRVVCGLDKPVS